MGRKKNKKNNGKIKKSNFKNEDKILLWIKKYFAIGVSGFFIVTLSFIYDFLKSDVQIYFDRSIPNGYEFNFKNTKPSDQQIISFRVLPPIKQEVIYEVIDNIYSTINKDGSVSIPGGPNIFVPAAEFKELDGVVLPSKSQYTFRLPPLSDRSWLEIKAALIDIEFSTVSNNYLLNKIEELAYTLKIIDLKKRVSFLVVNNYWTQVKTGSLNDAISQACRESSSLSKISICKERGF